MRKKTSGTKHGVRPFCVDAQVVWRSKSAFAQLQAMGLVGNKHTFEPLLSAIALLTREMTSELILDCRDYSSDLIVLMWEIEQTLK